MKNVRATIATVLLLLAGVLAPTAAQAAPELNDETIYAIFDQANTADIATGRLGWKKGSSPEVRKLARMVVSDHIAVQQMGRELAASLNLVGTPPDGDGSIVATATAMAELERLSGAEFDRAYLHREIAFHASVIEAVRKTLLPAIEDERFRQLVQSVLPGFEKHLAATRALAKKLGIRD